MSRSAMAAETDPVKNKYSYTAMQSLTEFVKKHNGDEFKSLTPDEQTTALFDTAEATVLFFAEWLKQQSDAAITTGYIAVLARCMSRLKISLDMAGAPPEVLNNFDACRIVAKELLTISTTTSASLGEEDIFQRLANDEKCAGVLQALNEIRTCESDDLPPPPKEDKKARSSKRRKTAVLDKLAAKDVEQTGQDDKPESSGGRVKSSNKRRKEDAKEDSVEEIEGEVDAGMHVYLKYRSKESSRKVTKFGLTATGVYGCRATMYRLADKGLFDISTVSKACASAATFYKSKAKGKQTAVTLGRAMAAYMTTLMKQVWAGEPYGVLFAGPLITETEEGDSPKTFRKKQALFWGQMLADASKVVFKDKSVAEVVLLQAYVEAMKVAKTSLDTHVRAVVEKGGGPKKQGKKKEEDAERNAWSDNSGDDFQ